MDRVVEPKKIDWSQRLILEPAPGRSLMEKGVWQIPADEQPGAENVRPLAPPPGDGKQWPWDLRFIGYGESLTNRQGSK
jgi:hypothetical protein